MFLDPTVLYKCSQLWNVRDRVCTYGKGHIAFGFIVLLRPQ